MSNLTAEQRTFDSWFSSQPFPKQAEMRRLGVIPYREMPQDRYVFEVRPNSAAYRFDPIDDELRKEDDTFVSRERLREIVGRILDTLARSPDRTVRLHIELVRIALRTPDSLSYGDICSHYSMTRQGVHYRVKEMRRVLSGIAPRPLSPVKESPQGGGAKRVAQHRVKKMGAPPVHPSSLASRARVAPKPRKRHGRKA